MTEKQKETFGVLAIVLVIILSLGIYIIALNQNMRFIALRELIDIDAEYLGSKHPNTLRKSYIFVAYENEGYENLRLDLENNCIIGDKLGKSWIVTSTPSNPFIRDHILGEAMHPQYRENVESLANSRIED